MSEVVGLGEIPADECDFPEPTRFSNPLVTHHALNLPLTMVSVVREESQAQSSTSQEPESPIATNPFQDLNHDEDHEIGDETSNLELLFTKSVSTGG